MRFPFALRRSRTVVALAAIAAGTALAAPTPSLAGPRHDPQPTTGSSQSGQPTPIPSPMTGAQELTALPDTVQSPWLYAFAGLITASPADTGPGTDQCVRHDSVYGDSTGMHPQRQTIVVYADTSVQLTTWEQPKISYRRFATMTVGEVDFNRGKARRDHAAAGEWAFAIGYRLPTTEIELMQALLGYSGAVPPQTQPSITANSAFSTLTATSYLQVTPLVIRAAMLRLIARLPGVHISAQAQDPLLRLTVAVTMPDDNGAGTGADSTAYFDPTTGELLAFTQLVRTGYTPRSARLPYFREISLLAYGCHRLAASHSRRRPVASGRGCARPSTVRHEPRQAGVGAHGRQRRLPRADTGRARRAAA